MGPLSHSFHFLGVQFGVPRSPQTKLQVSVQIHPRSCARALDKVKAMQNDAVHPAITQRYLSRWAAWWGGAIQHSVVSLLKVWIIHTALREPEALWIASGLLPFKNRAPTDGLLT